MAHAIQPRAFLVVGLDHRPGRIGGVGVEEHRLLRLGVIIPFVQARLVDGRQFPPLQRVGFAAGKAQALFLLRDREPVFVQLDARPGQHPLQLRGLAHEFKVFARLAEPHHPFHARPVVPGPVVKHDLARRGQVFDIALEIPLPAFQVGGLVQRHHPCLAGVQMFGEAFDRAALAGRVAPLEQHHDPLPGLAHPFLHLQKLGVGSGIIALPHKSQLQLGQSITLHARHVARGQARRWSLLRKIRGKAESDQSNTGRVVAFLSESVPCFVLNSAPHVLGVSSVDHRPRPGWPDYCQVITAPLMRCLRPTGPWRP
jgi:hypothetical protein